MTSSKRSKLRVLFIVLGIYLTASSIYVFSNYSGFHDALNGITSIIFATLFFLSQSKLSVPDSTSELRSTKETLLDMPTRNEKIFRYLITILIITFFSLLLVNLIIYPFFKNRESYFFVVSNIQKYVWWIMLVMLYLIGFIFPRFLKRTNHKN